MLRRRCSKSGVEWSRMGWDGMGWGIVEYVLFDR
jgi:hypothetical protein